MPDTSGAADGPLPHAQGVPFGAARDRTAFSPEPAGSLPETGRYRWYAFRAGEAPFDP